MLSLFRRLKARGLAYNLVWPFKGGVAALLVVVEEQHVVLRWGFTAPDASCLVLLLSWSCQASARVT